MPFAPAPRPDLEALAEEAIAELRATGAFDTYSGRLPPRLRRKLARSATAIDDEARLEDIFAERMIALTRNDLVEDISDESFDARVVARSHQQPVLVDLYSDYCRPCTHILPVVYQLAQQYRDRMGVVKVNVSRNPRFREAFAGVFQVTPSFLIFRNGVPLPMTGPVARLLGQAAFVATTRAGLEKRVQAVLSRETS